MMFLSLFLLSILSTRCYSEPPPAGAIVGTDPLRSWNSFECGQVRTTFESGQWGVNIVPWWGYPPNINTDKPYLKAHVIIYSQAEFLTGGCDQVVYPVSCADPTAIYNFTGKDVGIPNKIHIKLGEACAKIEGELFSPRGRQQFMDDHRGRFEGAQISVGEESIWLDVELETKRTAGYAAGSGMCTRWDVPNGDLRAGTTCVLPIDIKDGWIWKTA